MLKKLFFLIPITLLPAFVSAQYKIHINKTNVFSYKGDYLIDVPLKDNTKNLLLIDEQGLIPDFISRINNASAFRNVDSVFVIQKSTLALRGSSKNQHSLIILCTADNNGVRKTDTLTLDNINTLTEKYSDLSLSKTSVPEDSIMFYHGESYGSECCPHDKMWDIRSRLDLYHNTFKEKYQIISTGKIYSYAAGKEGEHVLFYSLSNLTGPQKIEFIHDTESMIYNHKNGTMSPPAIYFPRFKFNPEIWKLPVKDRPKSIIYNQVDIKPKFKGGADSLYAYLWKEIHYEKDDQSYTVISFVVNYNGSLSNIKITRSIGDDLFEEKVIRVLKKSPPWIPGMINGVAVSSRFSIKIPGGAIIR